MQTPPDLAAPGSNSVPATALVDHVLKNNKPERLIGPLRQMRAPFSQTDKTPMTHDGEQLRSRKKDRTGTNIKLKTLRITIGRI
jgi:hypothetical protein